MKPAPFLKVPTMNDKIAFMTALYAAGHKLGGFPIDDAIIWVQARPERTIVTMYRDGSTAWMTDSTGRLEFARTNTDSKRATYLNSRRQFFDYVKTGYLS